MPPLLALSISALFTLYLLVYDCRTNPDVSKAIWIPLVWMIISGSRLLSQWIQWNSNKIATDVLLRGNPIDRIAFTTLILIGVIILLKRDIVWQNIFQYNLWLTVFLLYCGASVIWSDYPFVAFKRWIKELGNVIMVLVVLSDVDAMEAIRALNRRFAYFAIPLSIVFNKYFPMLSKTYDSWTGKGHFVGITTSKNMLGNLCMVCGLFFIWDLLTIQKNSQFNEQKKQVAIDVGFLIMIAWLFEKADSATALGTLIIGTLILLALNLSFIQKHIENVGVALLFVFCLAGILVFTTDILQVFVSKLGRDMTLTDRTYIWRELLNIKTDPILGVGYESFWLGGRLQKLWSLEYVRGINEAHNGYLETYLNLGFVGLTLLIFTIASFYKKICRTLTEHFDLGRYGMAFFVVVLIYNITESAFKGLHLVWFVFLLVGIHVELKNQLPERQDMPFIENANTESPIW